MTKSVLILHQDPKVVDSLRKGFDKHAGAFAPAVAEDPAQALDILAGSPVSVLVTDIRLLKADAYAFLSQAAQAFPDLHILVMVPPGSEGLKVEALEYGAHAFIDAPFRIDALAEMLLRLLSSEADGGELRKTSPGMFIQLIQMEEKTCTVRVSRSTGERGVLFFASGVLMDARLGAVHGEEAARKILAWDEVTIAIQLQCPVKRRVIETDVQAVLLDAMREKDEAATQAKPGAAAPPAQDPAQDPAGTPDKRISAPEWRPQAGPGDASPARTAPQRRTINLETLRTRLQAETGRAPGPDDIRPAPETLGLVQAMNAILAPVKPGALKACCLEHEDGRIQALLPTATPTGIRVPSKAMRDRVLTVLAELEAGA